MFVEIMQRMLSKLLAISQRDSLLLTEFILDVQREAGEDGGGGELFCE